MIAPLVVQPIILGIMLPATHTAALISNSCNDFSAMGCMCQLLSNHCLLTSGLVIQVLPDSVVAIEVLLSCTGCVVATWLAGHERKHYNYRAECESFVSDRHKTTQTRSMQYCMSG